MLVSTAAEVFGARNRVWAKKTGGGPQGGWGRGCPARGPASCPRAAEGAAPPEASSAAPLGPAAAERSLSTWSLLHGVA